MIPRDHTGKGADPPVDAGTEWAPEDRLIDEELGHAFAREKGRNAPSSVARPGSTADDLREFQAAGGEPGPADNAPGRWLAEGDRVGRFVVRATLGKGGFGVVYQAEDPVIRQVVALKVPRPDLVQNASLWNQLAREARVSARLHHPGIVRVYQAGLVDGTFHIASEYEEAEDLAKWLAKRPGGLPSRLAAELAQQLAEAVGHAHGQGIVHRDLKPANVLVIAPGPPGARAIPRLKITDFGLGRVMEQTADTATATGHWQGSPPYMAPEQIVRGHERIDERADIYALGAILYELLTGRPVYPARTLLDLHILLSTCEPPTAPRRLRPGVSADLETLAMACLEHDPARRPTAAELRDELARYLDGLPIRRRPLPWPERLARYARRRPAQAALIGVTAAGLAGLSALSVGLARSNLAKEAANRELRTTVARLDRSIASEREARDDLLASERQARRTAYEASLQRAVREIQDGRVEIAQELLHSLSPAQGEDDQREFTWRLLLALATREYTVARYSDLLWWREARELPMDLPDRATLLRQLGSLSVAGPEYLQNVDGAYLTRVDRHYWRIEPDKGNGGAILMAGGLQRRLPDFPTNAMRLLSPDGRTLASAGDRAIHPTDHPPTPVEDRVDLSLNGAGGPRNVRVLRVSRAHTMSWSADGGTLAMLAISQADESQVFPVFHDGKGRSIGHPARLRPTFHTLKSESAPYPVHWVASTLVVSPDGRLAAMGGWRPRLEVFETWTGRPLWALEAESIAPDLTSNRLVFSPDGRALAVGTSGGRVLVFDASTGRPISEFRAGTNTVDGIFFHPDADTVAVTLFLEDRIRIWPYRNEQDNPRVQIVARREGAGPPPEVWGLAFARGGKALVSCDDQHQLRSFDPLGRGPGDVLGTGSTGFMALDVHPDGNGVALVDFDGGVFLADLDRPGELERIGELGARGRAVAWSPDGQTVAAAGKSGRVLLRGPAGEQTLSTPHAEIYGLAWSPDGKTLALAGQFDRTISLWDVLARTQLITVPMPGEPTCLVFSPAGDKLIAGDAEGRLFFLDPGRASEPAIQIDRASESGGVWAVAFSPDGRTLATGGEDRVVRLWDPATARELAPLEGHVAKLHALAFSPDGQTLASADFGGKILLWDASPRSQRASGSGRAEQAAGDTPVAGRNRRGVR